MIRAFLSHSSADKERYVRIVADKLGVTNCVYDEYTFEFGLRPLEEIIRGIEISQLFVVFLSEAALNSEWVQKEIFLAHENLAARDLYRIFPIIIDPNLTHLDRKIPEWIRDQYNLKYVGRQTVAARRIRQRLREISWMHNPRLKERDEIFVGRNELVKGIEERIDDYDMELTRCIVATGLPRIGRASLLKHALIKSNVILQSYELPSILLRREESLEDLILKLFDLGFSQIPYPTHLLTMNINEKIDIAVKIVTDIQNAKEIVPIRDEGCIINYTREIQPWFDRILMQMSNLESPTFLITARYRARGLNKKPYLFMVSVPELTFNERSGLFKRLIEFERLSLTREEFGFFCGLFQGFPDQVRFACDLIHDYGVPESKKESYQITEFNSDRAAVFLAKYENDPKALDFLYLLSEFEFISLDFLFSLIDEGDYSHLLNEFIAISICDYVGIEKEFIRLNDAIRDYVRRGRLSLPDAFRQKLNEHIAIFFRTSAEEERDISDVIFSIKEAIKSGRKLPEKYLIPSYFLRSMRELYNERRQLDRVIALADILLEKEHVLDETVVQDVRYFLCLSLARNRDSRMLTEVQKIQGPEHNFLLGFYYRLQSRPKDAIDRLTRCLNEPIVSSRAKRELVQVYLAIEDYESASTMAQSNYEDHRNNPYHIQAYFNAVVNSQIAIEKKELLIRLIKELESIKADLAMQMSIIAKAEFEARCEGNYVGALDYINDAVNSFPDSPYPLITKAFLAASHHDLENLTNSYNRLENLARKRIVSDNTLVRLKCYIFALAGELGKALDYAEKNLRRCPDYSRQLFMHRLQEIPKRSITSS